jgi:hypothetical protein
MKVKPFKLFAVLSASLALFFGLGVGHALASATIMSDMDMNQMGGGQCQSSCTLQSQSIAVRPGAAVDEQNIDPQPAEPYYAAFIGVGWVLVVTVAAAYLFKYLRWRPPDIYKLNVAYRF